MIELSKNYVALNMAKFIYEEEAKLDQNKHAKQEDIKEYIFNLYEECLSVIEDNEFSYEGLDILDVDEKESEADGDDTLS